MGLWASKGSGGGGTAVKVEEIDRLRGEWGDRLRVRCRELENKRVSSSPCLGGGGRDGPEGSSWFYPRKPARIIFPSNVDVNIISHLHVSVVLIPFACANLKVDY